MIKKGNLIIKTASIITSIFLLNCLTSSVYAQTSQNLFKYTIKKGDTIYFLSKRFDTTTNEIFKLNQKLNPDNLAVGSAINIPLNSKLTIHRVNKGDTLWVIAKKYNSSIDMIAAKNFIENSSNIEIGEVLNIPKKNINKDLTLLQKNIITLLRNRDFNQLSKFAHPVKGVRFSPYSTVNPKYDLIFYQSQISKFNIDNKEYIWGAYDGSGEPIKLSPKEYFNSFVYDKDFAHLGTISYDKVQRTGNTIENQFKIYPNSTIVEYYFPGTTKNTNFDWSSLRLVFENYNGKWYLVGIIHNQWTI
jgi:LysM repeat protein